MGTNPGKSVTDRSLRFPAFITLAPSVTRCNRCPGPPPVVLSAVINGIPRHLDPLPLSGLGLHAAVLLHRYVAVVRPIGPPMAHRATAGHWWVTQTPTPALLAEHVHGQPTLPHDPALASALLARFLPDVAQDPDPDAPPPF